MKRCDDDDDDDDDECRHRILWKRWRERSERDKLVYTMCIILLESSFIRRAANSWLSLSLSLFDRERKRPTLRTI